MPDGAENNRKGHWFEKQFAEHMLSRLRFSEVKLNQKLNGKVAAEPYEVDIVGLKKNRVWTFVWIIAVLGMFLGEIAVVAPRLSHRVTTTATVIGTKVQRATGVTSPEVGIAIVAFGLFVIGMIGDRHSRRRIWVECKNRKQTIKRADLYKLEGNVNDVRARAGRRKSRSIDAVWYVSSVPYDGDAIGVAHDRGIELFIAVNSPSGLTFERVY